MPSLRRRVTDSKSQQNLRDAHDRDGAISVTSSPRGGGSEEQREQRRRSRRTSRTSEAQSEDEAASLERLGVLGVGLGTPSSRGGDSWGIGDEVVMGLE